MKKLLSIVLSMFLCFSVGITAFAADNDLPFSDSEMTISEAAEILGIDESEIEGMEIRRLPEQNNNARSIPSVLERGVYYEDFEADTFVGAIHRLNGTKFKYGMKQMSYSGYGYTLAFFFFYTDPARPIPTQILLSNSKPRYDSPLYNINYGEEIYFNYFYSDGGSKPAEAIIRLAIMVY